MILPIFNVLDDMDNNLINASYDLGATKWNLPPCHLPFIDGMVCEVEFSLSLSPA